MIPLYRPRSDAEATVIASMLEAYGVDFLMQGSAFSAMYPGPLTTSLNAQVLLVSENDAARARELLADFLDEPVWLS
ncbi:MAG TPA: DUF2007 domain-containing protein [Burkholderiaceae bacterium]|nr:DUF2007 domain-containing protein [Burkholderiaceae bacterium]